MKCINEGCINYSESQNNCCIEYRKFLEENCDEFVNENEKENQNECI